MTSPSLDGKDWLARVHDHASLWSNNSERTRELGRLAPGNLDALVGSGVLSAAVPAAFGGGDVGIEKWSEALSVVSAACGSTGWVATNWVMHGWIVSLFERSAQQEVFASGHAAVSGVFAPTGVARRDGERWILSGRWAFSTGCLDSSWQIVGAVDEAGQTGSMIVALVRASELSTIDDWNVVALGGTGSRTTVADRIRVPAHRVLSMQHLFSGGHPDSGISGSRCYPYIAASVTTTVSCHLGLARGALAAAVTAMSGRSITYTQWQERSAHPHYQQTIASVSNTIDAADALASSCRVTVQGAADDSRELSISERATVRGRCGTVVDLCRQAVHALHPLVGSTLRTDAPFPRAYGDLTALSTHALVAPNSSWEVQGRVLLGLDPESPFL